MIKLDIWQYYGKLKHLSNDMLTSYPNWLIDNFPSLHMVRTAVYTDTPSIEIIEWYMSEEEYTMFLLRFG